MYIKNKKLRQRDIADCFSRKGAKVQREAYVG